ncbi:DUF1501 domain-containing protein [Humisphaera borealis]|uniref:DUF1501 domain-containing protein n=1 Tax=Humisphaera borealis TaxID=2807512 RepID=A0A7M2X041_9BACT|nr:DUF1501 domain-containing protein [Humisphaera borealis]QOV91023.1 DUF1501 domain-containing protein [Humisphaera borealis]
MTAARFDAGARSLIRLQQRRTFLGQAARGVGALALSSIAGRDALAAATGASAPKLDRWPGVLQNLHIPPKAKRVIWLCMAGGPSHLETFDPKPKLGELHGKDMPESFTKGQPIAQLQGKKLTCFGPQHPFKRFGKAGIEICELFPQLGSVIDDICVIRSMRTEAINHDPAHTFINTGTTISGRPSMGSWITYGLGSQADNLPGFVVLTSAGRGGQMQPISSRQWSAGFLPSRFQGVHFRGQGDPVLYLTRPPGVTESRQRDVVSAVQKLNEMRNSVVDDPEVATRITQYEMAFAMQASVPELMDLSQEPAATLEMYGTKGADGSFAANCLLARRLAERGTRFIQLYHRDWDHHGNVKNDIKLKAEEVDRPCAALLTDLKQRGMLDDTLVIWGGEFGRTPMGQGSGRDHHMKAFSMWAAGGGIKGGIVHGATDELGYNAAEDICEVHDLHATMLHLLGVDHRRLTVKFQGRDFRLTDVHGKVVTKILA